MPNVPDLASAGSFRADYYDLPDVGLRQDRDEGRYFTRGVGAQQSSPTATAALEAASGAVSRGFASARIEDTPSAIMDSITPDVLAQIGRELIRRGECLQMLARLIEDVKQAQAAIAMAERDGATVQ